MSRTLKLTVAYDGTDFHGWQIQPDVRTVQGELERALGEIVQEDVRVEGAGRTDAGVHAMAQVVGAEVESSLPRPKLLRGTNAVLPPDVSVRRIEEAPPAWHARYDAEAKTYLYRIHHARVASPLLGRYAWHVRFPLDLEAMREAAGALVGRRDFRSFARELPPGRPAIRRVIGFAISRVGAIIDLEVQGDGFLYNMVRTMVGTLVEVGRGRWEPDRMASILARRDRRAAGPTAPPEGLCLVRVHY